MARSRVQDFTVRFPIKGLDQSRGVEDQDPLTSADLQNVRPFDSTENRARGGSRPGLGAYCAAVAAAPVQCLVEYYGTELSTTDPAGIQNRAEGALAVIGGYIYVVTFGTPNTMAVAVGQSSALLSTTAKVVWAAPASDLVYFSDGAGNRVYYDSEDNTVKTWALGTYAAADVERPFLYTDVFKTGSTTDTTEHGLNLTEASEVQTAVLGDTPTTGTFKLSFKGVSTTELEYDADAAAVQLALQALGTIGTDNATVVRSGEAPNYTHTITFAEDLANLNLPQIGGDATGLEVNEVQTVDSDSATENSFALQLVINSTTYTSDLIAFDARPEDVAIAISEGMSVVNAGDVQATGDALDEGNVLVEFRGQYAGTDMALMTLTTNTTDTTPTIAQTTAGNKPTITMATTTPGEGVAQADDDRVLEENGQNRGKFPNKVATDGGGSDAFEKESICVLWGQRVVLAGISNDPQNYYISRFQDPTDFDWRHRQRDLNKEANEEIRRYNFQVASEVSSFNTQLQQNIVDYNAKIDAQITRANAIGAANAEGYLVGSTRYGASTWVNKVPSNYYKSYDTLKKDAQAHERDLLPIRYGDIEDDIDRAVVGRFSPLGLIPDTITSLMPYNQDLLLFFCESSIWEMSGSPNTETFRMRPVTKVIGGAAGRSWCLGPNGDIFFVSSRGGIYNLQLQAPPRRISANRIDDFMSDVDVASSYINLTWNEEAQGFHIHITPHVAAATKHLFYDVRTDGWFVDKYGSTDLDPSAVLAINDRTSTKREVVLGCRDGALRYQTVGDSQTTDNGTAIDSFVLLGPFGSQDRERAMMITGLRGTIGSGSQPVDYEVLRGDTADEASSADPVATGTWNDARSTVDRQRASGASLFIKVQGGGDPPWTFERVLASTRMTGRVFGRTF
jgi:hypothetical protein